MAAEAAEQCGRAVAPEIEGMVAFADLAGLIAGHDLALVAWEEEGGASLRQTLRTNSQAKSVLLIVGPEGGLTEAEVEMAKSRGGEERVTRKTIAASRNRRHRSRCGDYV